MVGDELRGFKVEKVAGTKIVRATDSQKAAFNRFGSVNRSITANSSEAIYNDTYNNLRPRMFDGSHLEFPGMNQAISLRQHQKDAIWRTMSSGNTLLAHVVGSGKTFTMAAAGMKMKQAGLIKKPMYVVPNHMLGKRSIFPC